ncbi:MAG TPA: hypothetical protein VFR78_16545 [Pyrinomonadaceae bacterium]|nr:hypothetical protein [Pyrinomonadaceae bacterium]
MKRTIFAVCMLLAASFVAAAQVNPNRAAIEYESLMNMRFYEATGGFLVEGLEVVFPPTGGSAATFVITKPSGEVVSSVPLRFEPLEKFPAFGVFRPAAGNPGNVRVGQAGDFVMAVKLGNETVTTLPFSLKLEASNDPFNPTKKFVRDGPWSDLAFFSVITDDASAMLHFNYWLSTRELPAGMKQPKVTLHLLANGKEIAASRAPVVPDTLDWYFYERKELIVQATPKQRWLALSDVTKQDGEIVMIVKANGQQIKSYKTRVVGGVLQTLDRNRLNTEPRTAFISPRYVDLTDRSRSDFTMRDMFWLKKSP